MRMFGERRSQPRPDADKQDVIRRQRVVAEKLGKILGSTADDVLLDAYRRADSILQR